MHDAPPAAGPGRAAESGVPERPAALTREHIDRVLADFRAHLERLLDPPPAPASEPPAFDLGTLAAQFTALRHDVNLQTKAARAATEQAATMSQQLSTPMKPTAPTAPPANVEPLLKALTDIADALALARRQVERSRDALDPLLDRLASPQLPDPPEAATEEPRTGFFARVFGRDRPAASWGEWQQWAQDAVAADAERAADAEAAAEVLRPLLAGLADGYAMSLRRVEKVLPPFGLEPIECVGRPFDPEWMEVVEVVDGGPSGTVVEMVRQGYTLNEKVFRYAQVKVAR